MPTAVGTYPDSLEQVRELVEQHRRSHKNRLRLAVYFAPPRGAKRDIFLFEVIDGFGGDVVDPNGELFEFTYGSTPALPLPAGTSLHMLLTNPAELDEAARHDWKGLKSLRSARRAGRTTIIYADAKGRRLWEKIQ